jgi:hypothetical protein
MKWLDRVKRRLLKTPEQITYDDIKDVGTIFVGGRTWVKVEVLTDHVLPSMMEQVEADPSITARAVVLALSNIIREWDAGTFDIVFANQIENEE